MASVTASVKAGIRGLSSQTRQLGYAWIIGSVTLGTVALLILRVRPETGIFLPPRQPVAPLQPLTGLQPPYPFIVYPAWARLSVLGAVRSRAGGPPGARLAYRQGFLAAGQSPRTAAVDP